MPSPDSSALVLFSGGQDSTTCLFWALSRFVRVQALGFDYGQKHAVETEQARKIADAAGVPFEVIEMQGVLSGSALTEHEKDVSAQHERNEDLPASFDYSGYPDCRRVFIDSMQTSLSLAMDEDLRIHTPLMYLTKAETWKMAADLGTVAGQDVLETVRVQSHTDYNGDRSELHEWGYGQLDNPASKLRAKGYREAKEKGWV